MVITHNGGDATGLVAQGMTNYHADYPRRVEFIRPTINIEANQDYWPNEFGPTGIIYLLDLGICRVVSVASVPRRVS